MSTLICVMLAGPTRRIRVMRGAVEQVHTFEMHPYCGPIRCRKDGEPSKNPYWAERHPFWSAFEAWQAQGEQVDADGWCVYTPKPHPMRGKEKVTLPCGDSYFRKRTEGTTNG